MKKVIKCKEEIKEEESVEHLVTVLSCYLEEPMTKNTYKQACDYVYSWVKYRMPKKLLK